MRIAMIGQKGIPVRYGGIERHVEEIASRLAGRGHQVFVYCRPYYTQIEGEYRGIHLIRTPSIKTRNLDTASHSLISTAHVLSLRPDVVHYHALGPSALSFIPRVFGARTVTTVHGLDWRGEKWGPVATWILQRCEFAASRFPSRCVVVSGILKRYFEERYGRPVVHVPNGVTFPEIVRPGDLSGFGVSPGNYYLFVGRLGPEKGCDVMIEGFMRSGTRRKLVIVGNAHLNAPYEAKLRALADNRVVFTGAVYGRPLEDLWNGAFGVIHPSVTEGMSLSLLEAMAHRKCVIISDIPENAEVVADTALAFRSGDPADLARALDALDGDAALAAAMGTKALVRAKETFDWERIVDKLESVYRGERSF
jgi:glycosyltransferase involved in cell wall biosynthesis